MRVFMNFRAVRGPYGGANSFLRTLRRALDERGVQVTTRPDARFDIALLNALTDGIDLPFVERLAARGRPLVHRKVGYRVSGSAEMRAVEDGVVHGDRLQLEFSPFLAHTVFQSEYSRDVFVGEGFEGEHTIIHNGVDPRIYSPFERRMLRAPRPRSRWRRGEPLRVIVSSWSPDPNKGFDEYARIDRQLDGRRDVTLALVGQTPAGFTLERGILLGPRRSRELARLLRDYHVVLQLSRHETCSNALIEGLNCGLPAIYLDSGSNRELAGPYGVEYRGDFFTAVEEMRTRYDEIIERLPANPFRIELVVERYLELFERVA
jgi:glycosyltransferase involved in cell wall biosynthesis